MMVKVLVVYSRGRSTSRV